MAVTTLLTILIKLRLPYTLDALGHMMVVGKLASGVVQSASTGSTVRTACVRYKVHEDKVRQAFVALAMDLSSIEHVTSQ